MVWSPLLRSLASGSVFESCPLSLVSRMLRSACARSRRALSSFTFSPTSPPSPLLPSAGPSLRGFQRCPVLLAEGGDRPIARRQVLQQPDQLQIAACFPFQPAR